MAKYYENSTLYHYNWEQVLQGFWKRYPNPYSLHVLSEDTIEREIREDGKLYSKRVLTKTNRVPKWGERFFKAKFVCIIEESLVDPKSKTLTTYTRNIGFSKIMVRNWMNFLCLSSGRWLISLFNSERCWRSHLHTRGPRQDDCPATRVDWLPSVWICDCNSSFWLW